MNSDTDNFVDAIDVELEGLQRELLKKANARQDYGLLADKIEALRKKKQDLLLADADREGSRQRIVELEEFLDAQDEEITEYDEQLVKKLIEKITVYDDHFTVEFKSGLETDVNM